MKIIDRNGRLFGKISVIDVIVIAVVAVMALAIYSKNTTKALTSTVNANSTITYQLKVSGVRTYVGDAIQVGDELYDKDHSSGGSLGKITNIVTSPGEVLLDLQDGTMVWAPVEDGVNLLITVEGSGLISDGRYQLNRVYDLGVNSARNFMTRYTQFVGTVSEIQG